MDIMHMLLSKRADVNTRLRCRASRSQRTSALLYSIGFWIWGRGLGAWAEVGTYIYYASEGYVQHTR